MILLDTNVISELMKAKPNASVMNWVDSQVETDLYICAITKAEIEWGVALLNNGKRKQKLHEAAISILDLFKGRCLDYNCKATSHYIDIGLSAKRLGSPMNIEDMMIAAIAQAHNGLLVTRNIKDFDFLPDTKLYNPWG